MRYSVQKSIKKSAKPSQANRGTSVFSVIKKKNSSKQEAHSLQAIELQFLTAMSSPPLLPRVLSPTLSSK